VELVALQVAHVAERRVGDSLPDAAAQLGARNWSSLDGDMLGGPHRPSRPAPATIVEQAPDEKRSQHPRERAR
jgi:hypothetical protein